MPTRPFVPHARYNTTNNDNATIIKCAQHKGERKNRSHDSLLIVLHTYFSINEVKRSANVIRRKECEQDSSSVIQHCIFLSFYGIHFHNLLECSRMPLYNNIYSCASSLLFTNEYLLIRRFHGA